MLNNVISDVLEPAWLRALETSYWNGSLCSERALQAAIYHEIRTAWPGLYVAVEPCLGYRPDLVLANDEQALAIIELKFVPHGFVTYGPDFDKFARCASRSAHHECLKMSPSTGMLGVGAEYAINELTHFVFAAVGREDSEAFHIESVEAKYPALAGKATILMAGTNGGPVAYLHVGSKGRSATMKDVRINSPAPSISETRRNGVQFAGDPAAIARLERGPL
jgi:hypothetical protein